MKLNSAKKVILIVYAITIFFLCFILVPFGYVTVYGHYGYITKFCGYGPLWIPPESESVIDIPRLSIEIIGATLITGVIFILSGSKKTD